MFLHPCHDPFECFFLPILQGKDFDQNQSFLRGANHHEPQQHHHICWYNWNFPFLVKSTGWRFPKICWVLCHISVVNKSNFYWPTLAHSVAFDTIHIYPVILLARPWKLHQTGFYPQISNHPIFVNSPFFPRHWTQRLHAPHARPPLRTAVQQRRASGPGHGDGWRCRGIPRRNRGFLAQWMATSPWDTDIKLKWKAFTAWPIFGFIKL